MCFVNTGEIEMNLAILVAISGADAGGAAIWRSMGDIFFYIRQGFLMFFAA